MKIIVACVSCMEEKLESDDYEIDQFIEMRVDGPPCTNMVLNSKTQLYKCSICHKKVSITIEG